MRTPETHADGSAAAKRLSARRPAQGAVLLLLPFLAVLAAGPVRAEILQPKPILYPPTGSYYQLYEVPGDCRPARPHCGLRWREAYVTAQAQTYEGRQGRLAVIDDGLLFDFIQKHIRPPHEAWTGLRYFCATRDLRWVNGEKQPRTLKVWAPQWMYNPEIQCSTVNLAYMPVWLTPAIQFQATGSEKAAWFAYIEYPAPGPGDETAADAAADNPAEKKNPQESGGN